MSIVSAHAKGKKFLISMLVVALTGACSNASNAPSSTEPEPAAEKPPSVTEQNQTIEQDPISWDTLDVSSFFMQESNGTFILRDVKTQQTYVFNEERAKTRQPPQSTFKIANALIGLQTGAVENENAVKRWDGRKWSRSSWNHDHTLESAMRDSVLWYYQAMARDIGKKQMQEWLGKIDYGNKDISGGIDRFWNNSTLRITPMEEVDFLGKLVDETLPFDKDVMQTVKRIILLEESGDTKLYGKTGGSIKPPFGWFVGFVVKKDRTYIYATNMDGTGSTANQQAKETTLRILKSIELLE
ncbi:class D beta-lactamase [Paenibacillus donghaensis]|uniref:class D beta-lactamase n=1 Tax=Paenibacillus donghaensis TaxID=414771 RepID=UPI00188334D8|nr:class D beta-lactamase [Paenibacillus donghaensis]MBE9917908.1 class D beta-lactamase [Paenibacillus donghaensis]